MPRPFEFEDLNDWRFFLLSNPPSTISLDSLLKPCRIVSARTSALSKKQSLHSRNAAAKLMQIFPSHEPLPSFLTFPGILAVSSSSNRCTMPFWSRNPTMILGTPSRKDCAQNLSNFRSYLSISRSLRISADVFSSTQWIGSSFRSGLQSHTNQTESAEGSGQPRNLHVIDSPASTSPPRIMRTLPIPVLTTEQYCAALLTTSFCRPSISSRGVASHGCRNTDKTSNL